MAKSHFYRALSFLPKTTPGRWYNAIRYLKEDTFNVVSVGGLAKHKIDNDKVEQDPDGFQDAFHSNDNSEETDGSDAKSLTKLG